jgi:hypothetical protein
VTGTAGWEALVNGIPCLLLGGSWYQQFPGVFRADLSDIGSAIRKALEEGGERPLYENTYERELSRPYFRNDIHGVLGSVSDPEQIARIVDYVLREQVTGSRN